VSFHHSSDAVAVESSHEVSNGVTAPPTSSMRHRFKAAASRDREQFFRPDDLRRWIGAGTTELFEGGTFVSGERAEGILLMTGHGILQGGGKTLRTEPSLPLAPPTGKPRPK